MSEKETNAVAACEKLEQAWIHAKNSAIEKQELMLLAIKTHLGGAGPAPTRHDIETLEKYWHEEHHLRKALDEFISDAVG